MLWLLSALSLNNMQSLHDHVLTLSINLTIRLLLKLKSKIKPLGFG